MNTNRHETYPVFIARSAAAHYAHQYDDAPCGQEEVCGGLVCVTGQQGYVMMLVQHCPHTHANERQAGHLKMSKKTCMKITSILIHITTVDKVEVHSL